MRDNGRMSRGWESKSVESQMEDAASSRSGARGSSPTSEQLRVQGERQSLELSRTRVLNDLAIATHPRRREQLLSALRHLEGKISALE